MDRSYRLTQPLSLECHRQIPSDPRFQESWDALLQATGSPEVFYTCEWAMAVERAYGQSLRPLVFCAYRNQELAGLAALALTEDSGAVFLCATTADYCDFVSAPQDRPEFLTLVFAELGRMGVRNLRLANVPADSPTASVMRAAARQNGFFNFTRPAYLCAQISLDSPAARRDLTTSAQRKLKRIAGETSDCPLTISHSGDSAEARREFPAFTTAHVGRFLSTGRLSNLVSADRRRFLLELSDLLGRRGWLTLSKASFGERTVAWNYGFRFAGKWLWYQPAFHVSAHQLSPGTYLLCRILQAASADNLTRSIDLGLGDESYKQRYSHSGRQTMDFSASQSRRSIIAERLRYSLVTSIGRFPRIERWARTARARARALTSSLRQNGVLSRLGQRGSSLAASVASRSEVLFFDLSRLPPLRSAPGLHLQPASLDLLAGAAMAYEHDPETMNYLLRSAGRLSAGTAGYVLTTGAGVPVHFCWVAPFEGFRISELKQTLPQPAPRAVLLFDCWTPQSERGQGFYGVSAAMAAGALLADGKSPWIFTAASNESSLRGLRRLGIIESFTLVREKSLFATRILKRDSSTSRHPALGFHPAA
jgi:CelD/BcsL family acetyltransferase involved in cellulose biosynthesis